MVTDSCPQCESNHYDIQALSFQQVPVLLAPATFAKQQCQVELPAFCKRRHRGRFGLYGQPGSFHLHASRSFACMNVSMKAIDDNSWTACAQLSSSTGVSEGRINIQLRQVECTPPSTITINVDGNAGADRWLRLTVTASCCSQFSHQCLPLTRDICMTSAAASSQGPANTSTPACTNLQPACIAEYCFRRRQIVSPVLPYA